MCRCRSLRGRRNTLVLAKGSDVRPGVVWRRLGTGAVRVAGAVICCAPRGRMYALASSGVGWAPAQISWQVQHFTARQGVGCTPEPGVVWRRLGTGADFVAGAVLCCLPRGHMYALASSGVGWAPAQISWQAQYFTACQGVVWRAPAQISWQVQHFATCPGVGCTPWRRLASAGHRCIWNLVFSSRLRGRCLRSFAGAQSYVESTV